MNGNIVFSFLGMSQKMCKSAFFWIKCGKPPRGILGYSSTRTSFCLTKGLPALNLHETVFDMLRALCVTPVLNSRYHKHCPRVLALPGSTRLAAAAAVDKHGRRRE